MIKAKPFYVVGALVLVGALINGFLSQVPTENLRTSTLVNVNNKEVAIDGIIESEAACFAHWFLEPWTQVAKTFDCTNTGDGCCMPAADGVCDRDCTAGINSEDNDCKRKPDCVWDGYCYPGCSNLKDWDCLCSALDNSGGETGKGQKPPVTIKPGKKGGGGNKNNEEDKPKENDKGKKDKVSKKEDKEKETLKEQVKKVLQLEMNIKERETGVKTSPTEINPLTDFFEDNFEFLCRQDHVCNPLCFRTKNKDLDCKSSIGPDKDIGVGR